MTEMPNDAAPYSGAIEESAKAAGKALDIVKDAANPIADVYGLIIGDHVHAARHRRLDAITRKTKKILRDRDLAETAEIAEQIAIPLLEAAQGEPREEMQDLWARLLANAMDPNKRNDVRPEFIRTLKSLEPLDALLLTKFDESNDDQLLTTGLSAALKIRPSSVEVSIDNLVDARLVRHNVGNGRHYLTGFGKEFLLACHA
jgi:hypothetical protein